MQSHSLWGLGMCNLTIYLPQRHLQGSVWWYGKMGWKVFFKPQGKVTGMFIWENIQKMNSELWPQVWGEEKWSGQGLVSAAVASEIRASIRRCLVCPCGHLKKGRQGTLLAGTWGQDSTTLVWGMRSVPGPARLTAKKTVGSWAASLSPFSAPCSLPPSWGGPHVCWALLGLVWFLLQFGHGGLGPVGDRQSLAVPAQRQAPGWLAPVALQGWC